MNKVSRVIFIMLIVALFFSARLNKNQINAQTSETAYPTMEGTMEFLTVDQVFARVNPSPDQLTELRKTYTEQWQLQELSTWSDDELQIAKEFAYDFLATSKSGLDARRALSEQYLKSINLLNVIGDPMAFTNVYKTQDDIDKALSNKRLVILDPAVFKLRNSRDVLVVDVSLKDKIINYQQKFLGDKAQLLWGTASTRSAAEQSALQKFGYPAAPLYWGVTPNMAGFAFGLAITDYRGTGGVYDDFLQKLESDGLTAMGKCVLQGQQAGQSPCYPTYPALIKMGAIKDQKFVDLWSALNSDPDFFVFDLTGFYSLTIHEDGSYELGTINPAFVIVYKDMLQQTPPTPAATLTH